ncbi:TUG-UBL1 domain-containing protein [Trichostrongylus colubriformis]|uniref:TUG-UBL1 domain-containing protein n=1 Tax=Trichostrongylus colubriformis TaxID=6319 RepID=A0AAN8FPY8_TRICO
MVFYLWTSFAARVKYAGAVSETFDYCSITFSMSSVTVLCPNARRCPVKVTPTMLMRQVLDEVCLKNGFDAEEYQLSNQNRNVDLALPFRLTGLPNNATLEMVYVARSALKPKATIALQLPNGSRLENEFPISTSLYEVLAFFSQLCDEDLTATSSSSTPTCSYMNRQYAGPFELQRTTLSSIGISSGKCLIRYQRIKLTKQQMDDIAARIASDAAEKEALLASFAKKKAENEDRAQLEAARLARFEEELRKEKYTKKPSDSKAIAEPSEDVKQFTQSANPAFVRDMLANQPRSQSGWSFDAPVFSTTPEDRLSNLGRLLQQVDTSLHRSHQDHDRITNILAEEGRVPLSRLAVEATRIGELDDVSTAISPIAFAPPCERQSVIFRRQINVGWNEVESCISDDFFEVSVDDIKVRQKELGEEVRLNSQRALVPTQFVKERNRERKLAAYRHAVIRVPVGSERMIQAQFRSAEPISRLYEWIRTVISRDVPFTLKLALVHNIEDSNSLNFVDADLAPRSTVTVLFKDSLTLESVLCENSLQECDQNEANKMCSTWLSVNSIFKPYIPLVEEEERTAKRPSAKTTSMNSGLSPPPQKATPTPRWLAKK